MAFKFTTHAFFFFGLITITMSELAGGNISFKKLQLLNLFHSYAHSNYIFFKYSQCKGGKNSLRRPSHMFDWRSSRALDPQHDSQASHHLHRRDCWPQGQPSHESANTNGSTEHEVIAGNRRGRSPKTPRYEPHFQKWFWLQVLNESLIKTIWVNKI